MKNRVVTILFLLVAFLMLPFSASAVTPMISSVSGTVANGQTLTISGTNMVQENTANWDSNFSTYPNMYGFEGSVPPMGGTIADGYEVPNGNGFAIVYDTSTKLSGNQSMKMHVYGNHGGVPNDGSSGMGTYPHSSTVQYWRYYARFHAVNNIWPDNYTKQYGLQGSTIWYTDLRGGGQPSGSPPGVEVFFGSSFTAAAATPLVNDRWYLFEGYATSGVYQEWIDNQLVYSGTPSTAFSAGITIFGIINYATTDNVADLTEWMDDYAYGSTGRIYASSLIEISGDGGSTWKYQPPTALSDTSIGVSEELPTLTAANYKLRITNNLQQTSATYTLGSADTTPPAAPSGLSVS